MKTRTLNLTSPRAPGSSLRRPVFVLAVAAALAVAVPAAYAGKGTNGLSCKTTAKGAVTMTHSIRWPGASYLSPRGLLSVGKGQPAGKGKSCVTHTPLKPPVVKGPVVLQPVPPAVVNPPLPAVPVCTPTESRLPSSWVYGDSDAALADATVCTQPAAVEAQAQTTDNGAANADTAAQTTDNGAGNVETPAAAPAEEAPYYQAS